MIDVPEKTYQKTCLLGIHGHGGVEVDLVTAYLADLKYAYDSITVFISEFERLEQQKGGIILPGRRPSRPDTYVWNRPTPEQLESLVPHSEQLVLAAVELSSPGFWEFLGTLNPLEVIRKYLNDRHERRKDKDYKESAEKRYLDLKNIELEHKLMKERIEIVKSLGYTDSDIAPLLGNFLYKPLTGLNKHQDQGLIEDAELTPVERKAA